MLFSLQKQALREVDLWTDDVFLGMGLSYDSSYPSL